MEPLFSFPVAGGLNNSVGLRNVHDYADFAVFNENIWLRTSVEEKTLSHSTLLPPQVWSACP